MKIVKNENGTYTCHAKTGDESEIINVLIELATLAWERGEMTDDDINNHGCRITKGATLNYCTIPSMDWVMRTFEEHKP